MKVLTVRQPWAGLIALGIKDVENRTWSPLPKLQIGERFAIHAGRADDEGAWPGLARLATNTEHELCQVSGLIIATVRLVRVRRSVMSNGWAVGGLYNWRIDQPYILEEPIACKGRLGLWEIGLVIG